MFSEADKMIEMVTHAYSKESKKHIDKPAKHDILKKYDDLADGDNEKIKEILKRHSIEFKDNKIRTKK